MECDKVRIVDLSGGKSLTAVILFNRRRGVLEQDEAHFAIGKTAFFNAGCPLAHAAFWANLAPAPKLEPASAGQPNAGSRLCDKVAAVVCQVRFRGCLDADDANVRTHGQDIDDVVKVTPLSDGVNVFLNGVNLESQVFEMGGGTAVAVWRVFHRL